MLELDKYGTLRDNNKVIELWQFAEANKYNQNNDCSRSFLYWFSSLGQIKYTLDAMSSLLPNITTSDTLQLLQSYKIAKNHEMAQYALQLLVDNEFELNRQHFDVLITTSANNGDISSIVNIFNIMNSYDITPNQQTLNLIFSSLENYFEKNKYLLSNVNINSMIKQIQNDLINLCLNNISQDYYDEIPVTFMKWYCEFGDVKNASILYEDISFTKHALKSDIMEKLAVQQISLLFKNRINLSKAISLLQEILNINDDSLYKLFSIDKNKGVIIPLSDTSRRLFKMLNNMRSTNWCNVNVLNFLLHICYLSHDLHNATYILYQWYLHNNDNISQIDGNQYITNEKSIKSSSSIKLKLIEPNHETINYILKLYSTISCSSSLIQPKTIDWSIEIYQWLLNKYLNNEYILELISDTTQYLLKLLLLQGIDNDNIQKFCHILQCIKNVIPHFEVDPKIFTLLGKLIVNNDTQINIVMDRTINIYGYMLETRDATSNTQKITSVSDRARLLGSILTNYDKNICKSYKEIIGGDPKSYFQIRRDLQQQFVLKLHRKYSLNDILTLDVLKLTNNKPRTDTNAFTKSKNDVKTLIGITKG